MWRDGIRWSRLSDKLRNSAAYSGGNEGQECALLVARSENSKSLWGRAMNSSFLFSGRSQSARHAAMKHDRDRGDERRDRGRPGRGANDSRRSVSPQARRPQHEDRPAHRGRHDDLSAFPPDQRSDRHSRRRSREDNNHRSHRRSVSRGEKHRGRDRSPRFFDDRQQTRTRSRESSRRSPGAGGGAFTKRPRSRSPPSPSSRRKKSRRSGRNRRAKHSPEFEKPEPPRRHRERRRSPHRSPPRRGRSGDRLDRDTDSAYDRRSPERRPVEDRGYRRRGSETWSHASRDSSPRSPYRDLSREREPRSPSVASRGRDDHPNASALRPHSPHDHHRSSKGHPRGRRDQETGSGSGNAEAAMGSRGTGGFRGGYSSQQNSFPSHKQSGHDSRGSFSQSPTPNSSYHNSPASQSPYNSRSGRNGQQFSPSHP